MSRLVWATTTAIRVGTFHIGVKSATPVIRDALEAALRPHVVVDPAVPASHAIHVPTDLPEGARPVYRVFEECSPAFITPSLDRAIAVLAGYLSDYLPPPDAPATVIDLDAAALLLGKAAVVVPWEIPYLLPDVERRLRRLGVRLLEHRRVRVDATTAEVVVPPSPLVDHGPLTEQATAVTTPGRYPIRAWLFLGRPPADGTFSRAQALAHAMALAYRRSTPAQNLTVLAHLMGNIEVALAPDVDQTLGQACALLERAT